MHLAERRCETSREVSDPVLHFVGADPAALFERVERLDTEDPAATELAAEIAEASAAVAVAAVAEAFPAVAVAPPASD